MTIVGVGGVGKTRLALHLGEGMARAFPGGVWLVDLSPLPPGADVAQAAAAAVGVVPEAGATAAAALAARIDGTGVLLIVDNCEHLLDQCIAFTKDLLELTSDTRILTTSRQPLGVLGEHLLDVKPLDTPNTATCALSPQAIEKYDAIRLFTDRASSVIPTFSISNGTATTVAEVCIRLDGIPLAIELAAVRLRTMSLPELLSRLDDQHQLLNLSSRVAQPRQQSLRALNEWSHALCTRQGREVWARLSVFTDKFDLAGAEAVCADRGIERHEVLEFIAELIEKSVVVRVDDGFEVLYALMEPIRQYGASRLRGDGHTDHYRERHARHYRGVAMELKRLLHDAGRPLAHATVRHDYSHIAEAAAFLRRQPGHDDDVLELSTLLYLVSADAGTAEVSGRRLHEVLQTARPQTRALANGLWVDSMRARASGNAAEADTALARCQQIVDDLGDDRVAAYVTECAGLQLVGAGDLPAALERLIEAFDAHGHVSDQFGLRLCARHMTVTAWASDDEMALDRVAAHIDRNHLTSGSQWEPLRAVWTGLIQLRRHEPAKAEKLLGEAMAELRQAGEPWWLALSFDGLAHCAWASGNHARAARLLGFSRMAWYSLGVREPFIGASLDPHDICGTDLRRALGYAQFSAAVSIGAEFTTQSAVDYAAGTLTDPTASPEAQLTPREHEVAELVRDGLTNQAVGAALGVSKRTVESHIEHIMTKLGFTRRTQIATWFTNEHPDRPDLHSPVPEQTGEQRRDEAVHGRAFQRRRCPPIPSHQPDAVERADGEQLVKRTTRTAHAYRAQSWPRRCTAEPQRRRNEQPNDPPDA